MNDVKSVYPLIAARVRTRLEQHPVRGDRASWLADILSLSRAQIFRKLKGIAPWSLEELAIVADTFGCPLRELLQDVLLEPARDSAEQGGLMTIDGLRLRCRFRLGSPSIGLYALQGESTWRISASRQRPEAWQDVAQLEILGLVDRPRPLVLIIDDDNTFSGSLCHALETFGYSAIAISLASALDDGLQRFAFIDAFIVGVDLAKASSAALGDVVANAARQCHAPVVVLIANDHENRIAPVINGHGVVAIAKPVEPAAVASALDTLLEHPEHPRG